MSKFIDGCATEDEQGNPFVFFGTQQGDQSMKRGIKWYYLMHSAAMFDVGFEVRTNTRLRQQNTFLDDVVELM